MLFFCMLDYCCSFFFSLFSAASFQLYFAWKFAHGIVATTHHGSAAPSASGKTSSRQDETEAAARHGNAACASSAVSPSPSPPLSPVVRLQRGCDTSSGDHDSVASSGSGNWQKRRSGNDRESAHAYGHVPNTASQKKHVRPCALLRRSAHRMSRKRKQVTPHRVSINTRKKNGRTCASRRSRARDARGATSARRPTTMDATASAAQHAPHPSAAAQSPVRT